MFTETLKALVLLALPLAQAAPAAEPAAQVGSITWFNPGLGACGRTHGGGDLITAVSAARFDAQSLCGRKIRVQGPAGSALVEVVDRCAGCAVDDLDLSPAAFRATIGDLGIGRTSASWHFV